MGFNCDNISLQIVIFSNEKLSSKLLVYIIWHFYAVYYLTGHNEIFHTFDYYLMLNVQQEKAHFWRLSSGLRLDHMNRHFDGSGNGSDRQAG